MLRVILKLLLLKFQEKGMCQFFSMCVFINLEKKDYLNESQKQSLMERS